MSRGAALALAAALVSVWLPASAAETENVEARDNFFSPREIHVDVGETIEWRNAGSRAHTVTSDSGAFDSGRMSSGDTFRKTFKKEGYFFYHCRLHGSPKTGMWGTVVVGDPPPATQRTKLHVPRDFETIQRAVDKASPGSTIVVAPGTYRESVTVRIPDLVIRGVDRFRTVIHGRDSMDSGISVEGADDVVVKNLTVRNFLGSGILIRDATGFTVARVDSIKNRTFGINASGSFDGAVRSSFAWGSGDSGVHVADCYMCSVIVRRTKVLSNYLGISIRDASGVVVKGSRAARNGTGIGVFSLDAVGAPTTQSLTLVGNRVSANDYSGVPAAGFSHSYGLPFGTGIWLAGAATSAVMDNLVGDNQRYGVLVTGAIDGSAPSRRNEITGNTVRGSSFGLAWDGVGSDTCFSANDVDGVTGPSDIQSLYPCNDRPFEGEPFDPVIEDVAAAVADTERVQEEPAEPRRPRCQRGAPGCNR